MLPGMAAIALFLLVVSLIGGLHMLRPTGMPSIERYSILGVCTLVVIGVFGLLRLRRWGWALVSGGCLFGTIANFIAFHRTHIPPYLIQGLFLLVFFLYLARPEVRSRVH